MKKLFGIFAIGLIVCSCGKKKEDDAAATTELEGTWKKSCTKVTTSLYTTDTIKFTGSNYERTVAGFTDASCATAYYTAFASGTTAIGDALTTPTGAKKVNDTVAVMNYTLNSASAVSTLSGLCGITDWVLNVARDVLGKNCSGKTVSAGTIDYLIFKIDGTSLYLGDVSASATDGTTDAKRPTALETTAFTKQ